MTNAIPEGFSTITPSLMIDGAAEAIELYKKAFGAKEIYTMPSPDGRKIMHACLQIGSSKVFLADLAPEMGADCASASQSSFYLYLDDIDSSFTQAKKAGLEVKSEPQDMFWGDRTGSLKDKFGIRWTLASHVRDVSDDEIKAAMQKMTPKAA